jgi:hypothetical protein
MTNQRFTRREGVPSRAETWVRQRRATRLERGEQRQSGQALPLAAVGIFVMCLGVIATMNLGQAVHQRIKLQNTADSAAYTLAAMEARTFNYIAFLNRAQLAHYNTAAVIQSYMTYVGYHRGAMATALYAVTTYAQAHQDQAQNETCPYCPYTLTEAVAIAAQVAAEVLLGMINNLDQATHRLGHWLVEAMAIFNKDQIWRTQLARAALMNVNIVTGMQQYIEKLDPDISFGSGSSAILNAVVNMAMNSIEYYQTFDNASGVNPYFIALIADANRVGQNGAFTQASDDQTKDAHRLMAELANATRSPDFVFDRAESVTKSAAVLGFFVGRKRGATKFTEGHDMDGAEISAIRSEQNYPLSKTLASDDYHDSGTVMAVLLGYATWRGGNELGDAIAAYEDDGKHYFYKGVNSSQDKQPVPGGDGGSYAPQGSSQMQEEEIMDDDENAAWPGFAPYFKFNARADRTADYNQPSTWIFLNKHHENFQSAGSGSLGGRGGQYAPWRASFSMQNGTQEFSLDTTIGGQRNSYFLEGLSVLARGMAYYHRPGRDTWGEHPNFFNPFWRARLAPVGQKLQAFWERYVGSNINYNAGDNANAGQQVLSALVNVLRAAQMDVFTSLITSLITH